jgi:carbon monoxide dehydrogenase subunit G
VATEVLRRDFDVQAPLDTAWHEFADVATWPAWAPHIRRITVAPPGLIGPTSVGHLSFRPIGRSGFRISAYNERANWEWVGKVLWLTIRYDHRFEAAGDQTHMTWTVSEAGERRSMLGRLFGSVYGRLVDRAIPRLQARLASDKQGA